MRFLAPEMLAALALGALPIIIHLLNRRRFVRIDWAPMEYLKLTLRTNRRRIQLEQWLLLALRVAAMLLLAFALARPTMSDRALAWLGGGKGRAARILVIDDSPSMAASRDGISSFSQATGVAAELVRAVGAHDQLTVVTTSMPELPLIRQAQVEDPTELLDQLAALRPRDVASQWSATLEMVDEHLRGAAYPIREVVLITDLRADGWRDRVEQLAERWAGQERLSVRVIDVGVEPGANLAVTELRQSSPVALVGEPARIEAELRNQGAETIRGATAVVVADERRESIELPDLPAGEAVVVPATLRFDTPGQHRVRWELPADAQPADDQRQWMVEVRTELRGLLVDGEPGPGFQGETPFLRASLLAGASPWRLQIADDLAWRDTNLDEFDVVVLANVAVLPERQAEELERRVREGMGLMIWPGDLLDPESYNRLLFRDGEGILPAQLEESQELEAVGLNVAPFADSALAILGASRPELLARVRPTRVLRVGAIDRVGLRSRILAHWNEPLTSPALLERRVGNGVVYLWTVTADRKWSDWPQQPSFVLAARQAMLEAARRLDPAHHLLAGQTLRAELPPTGLPSEATVEGPSVTTSTTLTPRVDREERPSLEFADTTRAGFYRLAWQANGGEFERLFAVNLDPRECDPERLSTIQLQELLAPLQVEVVRASGGQLGGVLPAQELWRFLAVGLLVVLGVESLFGAWVSRER